MAKLNPRKLMEQAIEVMRQTVSEPRADGKANPLVGAVLWKPGGTVETASRGELRYGDHAEYTLLERKNRHCKLDGAVLFATLEPCAPESRREPKPSCSERVVLARIKVRPKSWRNLTSDVTCGAESRQISRRSSGIHRRSMAQRGS